ncbi:hypothetical protein [Paenibacillus sp. MBLB4367]|uniref:hypothetical protein n=1 Tax=Paenibacillus sp. MBLB4367 TaxID=3384767 RepID=UPI0039082494
MKRKMIILACSALYMTACSKDAPATTPTIAPPPSATVSKSSGDQKNKPVEQNEKVTVAFQKELVRLGEFDLAKGKNFDFQKYQTSALTKVDKEISEMAQPLLIEWKKEAEVEVFYNDVVDINRSQWKVKPDPKHPDANKLMSPKQGDIASFKIESTRSIVKFAPWTYVPNGDGGEVELQFRYVLKDGTAGMKSWTFKVGKAE